MVFPELWDALAVLPCLQLNSPFFTGFTSYRPHLQTEGKAKGSTTSLSLAAESVVMSELTRFGNSFEYDHN